MLQKFQALKDNSVGLFYQLVPELSAFICLKKLAMLLLKHPAYVLLCRGRL